MTLIPVLLWLAAAPTEGALPRSGYFGAGINLEPLSLGPVQAFSGGGASVGLSLQSALQIDLGTRWALRLPLDLCAGGSSPSSFAQLGFTPGVLHRWRDDAEQQWVPYLGGGFKLGLVGAGRGLLGLPSTTAQALDLDFDDFDGDGADPDLETGFALSPELWAGVEWHPTRWFSLNLGGAYTYTRLQGAGVHMLHQRVGMRFSL